MKKLHILALSMLLSTSAVIMQADSYDQEHHLNKKRNDNTYDGSKDACEGQYLFVDDNYDTHDEINHLNKKRNSETHPICGESCNSVDLERVEAAVEKAIVKQEIKAVEEAQVKEEIKEIKQEIKDNILAIEEVKVQNFTFQPNA